MSRIDYYVERFKQHAGNDKYFPVVLHEMKRDFRVDQFVAKEVARHVTGKKVPSKIRAYDVLFKYHVEKRDNQHSFRF